jgi:hypothetical protein
VASALPVMLLVLPPLLLVCAMRLLAELLLLLLLLLLLSILRWKVQLRSNTQHTTQWTLLNLLCSLRLL